MSEVIDIEDDQVGGRSTPKGPTLAESLTSLLTSMKLFGLYFRCRMSEGDKSTTEKSRVEWNMSTIYAVVVVIVISVNTLRLFSVFSEFDLARLHLSEVSSHRLFLAGVLNSIFGLSLILFSSGSANVSDCSRCSW